MEFLVNKEEDFQIIAKYVLENIFLKSNKNILCLTGELGTGKTTFTKYIAKELGIKDNVTSPTFIIHNEYIFNNKKLNHLDLYRLEKESELNELNLTDTIKDQSITIIEWADKFKDYINSLSKNICWISFEYLDIDKRKVTIL